MKLTSFGILFLIFTVTSRAQQNFFEYKQDKLSHFIAVEKSMRSVKMRIPYKVTLTDQFIPHGSQINDEVAQPIAYDRTDSSFSPSPRVSYYFNLSDSLVRLIEYDWDAQMKVYSYPEMMKKSKEEMGRKKDYDLQYSSLFQSLNEKFGKPTKGDGTSIIKHSQFDSDESYTERDAVWKSTEATIELYMIWADTENNPGTYRIRALIYWEN